MKQYDSFAMILLAQDGAAPPRESAGAQPATGGPAATGSPATPGAPGAPGVPGTTTAPGSTGTPAARPGPLDILGGPMSIVLVIIVVFIIMSMSGTRREKRKREAMLSGLKKHDKVQTIGGVIGSVVEVKASTVVLKVDESSNTRMTFARTAIQQVLDTAPDTASSSTNDAAVS